MTSAPLLLALVLSSWQATAPAPTVPTSSRANDSGVVGRVAEYKLGAAQWFGAPPPTIDLNAADFKPGDSAWVDRSGGVSFTKNGSPTAWVGSPFMPDGYLEATHNSASGFSSAPVGYSLGTSAALSTQTFSACIVYQPDPGGNACYPVQNGNPTTGPAYYVRLGGQEAAGDGWNEYGGTLLRTGTTAPAGINVACYGRSATTKFWRQNAGPTASNPANGSAPTTPVLGSTQFPCTTTKVFEFFHTTTEPTDAYLTALANAAMSCRSSVASPGAPCIPEDANTVTHVTFDASANPIDTKGLAWAKQGSPTASASVYRWPNLRTPLMQPATRINAPGGDYFEGGNVGNITTAGTVCFEGFSAGTTGSAFFVRKWDGTPYGWIVYSAGTSLVMRVCNGSTCTSSNGTTIATNAWNVACFSISNPSGNGTILGNVNGSATSSGPSSAFTITNNTAPLQIGPGGVASTVARVSIWNGWAASAPELDKMVRSQIGLLATKPAGTVLPFSRADVGTVCPITGVPACFYVGAGIPEIEDGGIWVGGASSNKQTDSTGATWTATGTAAISAASTDCPFDPLGVRMTKFTGLGLSGNEVYQTATGSAGAAYVGSAWLARPLADANCVTRFGNAWADAGLINPTLTVTPTRYWAPLAYAGLNGGLLINKASPATCTNVCISQAQSHDGNVPFPFRPTAGSAYTGPATTHQGIPPRTDSVTWTNRQPYSEQFDQATKRGSGAVVADATIDPRGGFSADKVTVANIGANDVYLVNSGFSNSTAISPSLWFKRSSTSGSAIIQNPSDAALGKWTVDLSQAALDSWTRLDSSSPLVTVVNPWSSSGSGAAGFHFGAVSGSVSFFVSGGMQEQGTTVHPYCPTGASTSTCGDSGGLGKTVTNALPYNTTLNGTGWVKTGSGITVEDNSASCPIDPTNNAQRMSLITFGATPNTGVGKDVASTPVHSVWYATATGDAACSVGDCDYNLSGRTVAVTSTPTRTALYGVGRSGILIYLPIAGDACARVCVAGAQVENATSAGAYCGPTGAASKTCTFVERAANPWAVSVTAKFPGPDYFTGGGALFAWGAHAQASTATFRNDTSSGDTYLRVYDLLGGTRDRVFNTGWTGVQTVLTTSDLNVYRNGTAIGSSLSGSGTGILSYAPTTFYLGQLSIGAPYMLNARIKSWATCRKAGGCR